MYSKEWMLLWVSPLLLPRSSRGTEDWGRVLRPRSQSFRPASQHQGLRRVRLRYGDKLLQRRADSEDGWKHSLLARGGVPPHVGQRERSAGHCCPARDFPWLLRLVSEGQRPHETREALSSYALNSRRDLLPQLG